MKTPKLQRTMLCLTLLLSSVAGLTAEANPPGPSIIDIALTVNGESGEFSTLIAALSTAELVEPLDGNRQLTVFAPTDAAFAEIGLDAESIVDVPVDTLSDILLYHVSPGRRLAEDVLGSDRVRMLNKSFTFPSLEDGVPFINDAQILSPDIEARNGVIHVIGGVLDPSVASFSSTQAVPEPISVALLGLGLTGVAYLSRKRR